MNVICAIYTLIRYIGFQCNMIVIYLYGESIVIWNEIKKVRKVISSNIFIFPILSYLSYFIQIVTVSKFLMIRQLFIGKVRSNVPWIKVLELFLLIFLYSYSYITGVLILPVDYDFMILLLLLFLTDII